MAHLLNYLIPHVYLDSIMLMELSVSVEAQSGVQRAMALMATKPNLDLLEEFGLLDTGQGKSPQDGVLLAIETDSEGDAQAAVQAALELLATKTGLSRSTAANTSIIASRDDPLPSFTSWAKAPKNTCVAVISVPGEYAAAEAWKALKAGQHVVLFSNRVALEDEFQLKQEARERGLLMLGAECGTAILDGFPLGFANLIRRGSIGLVAASGSGLQEVTCLIDRWGGGITHAIGVGGRDLSAKVSGLGMQAGLEILASDQDTRVIVLLSKPPDPKIADHVLTVASATGKPVVACFLGLANDLQVGNNLFQARTLEEAAAMAVRLAGLPEPSLEDKAAKPMNESDMAQPGFVRGLFSGGTLAYEAMLILTANLGPVYSNAPLDKTLQLKKGQRVAAHTILDLGTEEYTTGVPHPMIDGRFRSDLIAEAGEDPQTGVILLDVILGLGSDANPVAAIAPGIRQAIFCASSAGRDLRVMASITGTRQDPQGYDAQVASLKALGVDVYPSNAAAARQAARLLSV
jgi:FdrA protein